MTASVLVTGNLFRDPERKVSKLGNEYASATIAEGNGEGRRWWKILAFNDAAVELLRLRDGDAVSAQGSFDVSTYEKDGETRIGFSLKADRILSLRQPKERTAKQVQRPAQQKRNPSPDRSHASRDVDCFGDAAF